MSSAAEFHWDEMIPLDDLVSSGKVKLGRGNIISKIDIRNHPGPYPIYSSSSKNEGKMGEYGAYMFDEEMISWSVDGGGYFFYRPKHKFSVTNVSGYMQLSADWDYRFTAYSLQFQHEYFSFDYQTKAHPSVIRNFYLFPKVPIAEQKKIASILSSVDCVIDKTRAQIDKLNDLKTGMMQELLTKGLGHTEFKESPIGRIPSKWDVKSLPEVSVYQNGKAFPSSDYLSADSDGYFLIKPVNLDPDGRVNWGYKSSAKLASSYWEEAKPYRVGANEILMNLTAQSLDDEFLGRVCMTKDGDKCILNQRIARINSNEKFVLQRYLFWALRGRFFRAHVDRITQGSKVQHLYNSNLDSALIAYPTSTAEQEKICLALDSIEEAIFKKSKKLVKSKNIKKALLQDLLTGKVRVNVENKEPVAA